jgi:hypothetical protein
MSRRRAFSDAGNYLLRERRRRTGMEMELWLFEGKQGLLAQETCYSLPT